MLKPKVLQEIEYSIESSQRQRWHALEIDDVWRKIESAPEGLSNPAAADRLKEYGLNELPRKEGEASWKLLLRQFQSPLMYLMMVAVVVSIFINSLTSLIFISVVLFSNALVGFYQERKVNRSLQALNRLVQWNTRIVRGGLEQRVLASEVVPGDVVVLRPGDRIPADGRIFKCSHLKVRESVLTGEAKPVEKQVTPVAEGAEIGDRKSMVFMGTVVDDGSAHMVVVETGINTEYGDIVKMLEETPEEPTRLQRLVVSLSKIIGAFIFVVVVAIVVQGLLFGRPFQELFMDALALFVSAIPEGLLPAITIVLAVGMNRILKRRGLLRRLASAETLGGVTVICTDKTGTLTEGRMEVRRLLTADEEIIVDTEQMKKLSLSGAARLSCMAAVLTSDAYIENPNAVAEKMIIRGRSTEQAIVKMGVLSGLRKDVLEKDYRTLQTLFFSSENKYSATLRLDPYGETVLFAIGAPEKILERVSAIQTKDMAVSFTGKVSGRLNKRLEELIGEGFRVIACAYRPIPEIKKEDDVLEDNLNNLILLGLFALEDPIRDEVPATIQETAHAGIRTVVVTGDHPVTALSVAQKIGLMIQPGEILEGHEIEAMSDEALKQATVTTRLYARVSPRHKLRIVEAYKERGEVVAMCGDGVNDVPALKVADIGIAVSTEVDAAREVADLVLLDGGFQTIVKAVEQGRIIFYNIRRVFLYLVTQDFSEFFIFFMSIFFGLPLPLIAGQLLFVNLIESGLPDLALTMENERDGIMDERPRLPNETIVDKRTLQWLAVVFLISGTIAMLFYYAVLSFTGDLAKTRTMVMIFMSFEPLFFALSLRSFKLSIFRKTLFNNWWLSGAIGINLAAIITAIYMTPLQKLLELRPLSLGEWLLVALICTLEVIIVDELKLIFFGHPEKTATARRSHDSIYIGKPNKLNHSKTTGFDYNVTEGLLQGEVKI